MKVTRNLFAGAAFAVIAFSAVAADTAYAAQGDEGMPANVAALQQSSRAESIAPAERFEPQTLRSANGETRANPAFKTVPAQRAAAQEIRTQSYPATHYVGA